MEGHNHRHGIVVTVFSFLCLVCGDKLTSRTKFRVDLAIPEGDLPVLTCCKDHVESRQEIHDAHDNFDPIARFLLLVVSEVLQ